MVNSFLSVILLSKNHFGVSVLFMSNAVGLRLLSKLRVWYKWMICKQDLMSRLVNSKLLVSLDANPIHVSWAVLSVSLGEQVLRVFFVYFCTWNTQEVDGMQYYQVFQSFWTAVSMW